MPLANYTVEGTLSIGGISMNRPAWAILGDEKGTNGLPHLWVEFDVRGEDRILPGANAVIPYQRRITATRKDLRLLVVGDVNSAGAPVADPNIGLETNLESIRSSVLAPVVSATGTRAAILTMPSGATRTADIHVLGMTIQSYVLGKVIDGCARGAIAVTTLHTSIPTGRFV